MTCSDSACGLKPKWARAIAGPTQRFDHNNKRLPSQDQLR